MSGLNCVADVCVALGRFPDWPYESPLTPALNNRTRSDTYTAPIRLALPVGGCEFPR